MKLPWPNVFADGDVEKWIRDFELIASCNGIKGSAYMVTALGSLLTGRARAAYDLNLESNRALNYENLKSALVAEFSKEGDREKAMNRFYAAEYNRTEDPLAHYQYIKRQISLGLPEANNETRERLAKDRFIQSMPAQVKDKLRLALACGVNDAEGLISIVQACQNDDLVARVDAAETENKIEQIFKEIGRLKEELKGGLQGRRRSRAQVRPKRCFRCYGVGHLARFCPNQHIRPCFSVSNPTARGVPRLEVFILGRSKLAVIDTGAGISIMPRVEGVPVKPCNVSVRVVGGMSLGVLGKQCVSVRIGGVTVTHEMVLIEGVSKVIIGVHLLRRVGANIDFVGGKLLVGSEAQELRSGKQTYSLVSVVRKSTGLECPIPCVKQCVEKYS
ncbi:unnamed protein product [Echinostoma caproni]|uniref:CCHC-type domain-containing protein n=1 Tax=Echinostoma caproni TaxID=27848 RepID=A0A183BBE4_9TREM|nr:unnamed protein product [Echinostoma caproni]